ncbi:hypothetical protein T06_14847 [Trichinella sp. T6]|nr:hypothetical protein T06_11016 [Trichinella sp. T6]KRX72249.1 hypothetical protein T06_14847 [Trichinella sp. T6]
MGELNTYQTNELVDKAATEFKSQQARLATALLFSARFSPSELTLRPPTLLEERYGVNDL